MDNCQEIFVIGHRNPDTDSVCSAIAYAALKNRTTSEHHVPARAGELCAETAWVLSRFGLEPPRLLEDVSPQIRDVEIRHAPAVSGSVTVKKAWEIMRDQDISTLPVTGQDGSLRGIITLKDLAVAHMDSLDTHAVARAGTPYSNIAETLQGHILCGDSSRRMERGYILVGAGDPAAIREAMRPGDLLLVSNRPSAQRAAIENGAGCLVICLDAAVSPEIMDLAEEHACVIISTPYDTYKAAYFINQSVPVRQYMVRQGLQYFQLSTPVEDAVQIMSRTRFVYFPVLDDNGKYYGVISRRNLLNRSRKQLILVDHNEKSQCVPGGDQAEIREIIDHHRVGGIQTISPIFFRNQPIGSTATIIAQLYREAGEPIPPAVAGILCCAVLSDTLMLRSPTATETDRLAVQELAALCGEDPTKLGEEMFEAAEDLSGKSGEEILQQDYKIFAGDGVRFGVSQSTFFSVRARKSAGRLAEPEMRKLLEKDGLDYIFYLLTDIGSASSYVLCMGEGAEELLREAFALPDEQGSLCLRGVVSRKKQFIPQMMELLRRRTEEKSI